MTLKELVNAIGKLAMRQKLINFYAAGTSLYQLNPLSVEEYPVLFLAPTGNHQISEDLTTFEITLYYLERLLEDNSNDIDVFSSSIENLKNIIIGIQDIIGVQNVQYTYTIRNFAEVEKMNDRLAGSYATIRIMVDNYPCYDE